MTLFNLIILAAVSVIALDRILAIHKNAGRPIATDDALVGTFWLLLAYSLPLAVVFRAIYDLGALLGLHP